MGSRTKFDKFLSKLFFAVVIFLLADLVPGAGDGSRFKFYSRFDERIL